ncbi:pyridoxamine 5'-phosphate oxidase [Candidatus Acetothermia bacterium]|nr:pyridoxamine 5'-phosphate oxidase [Candidatus Acetothermia bacterium]MBI3643039.1 pyridoxamine 5'-phosphate oxidase [Candidatus Acetothermia bacterium]
MSKKQQISPLRRADLNSDPIAQFERWFDEASRTDLIQPNTMTLATSTPDGVPSARMVLMRNFDAKGFVFFTNYESQKGHDLAINPQAALVFYWEPLGRQIRITGHVERIPERESDQYFETRPLESRLGALVSHQSQVIPNRGFLEEDFSKLRAIYNNQKISRPSYWGGFRVIPTLIEFWQHRDHRLHDRFRYTKQKGGTWLIERLSP